MSFTGLDGVDGPLGIAGRFIVIKAQLFREEPVDRVQVVGQRSFPFQGPLADLAEAFRASHLRLEAVAEVGEHDVADVRRFGRRWRFAVRTGEALAAADAAFVAAAALIGPVSVVVLRLLPGPSRILGELDSDG